MTLISSTMLDFIRPILSLLISSLQPPLIHDESKETKCLSSTDSTSLVDGIGDGDIDLPHENIVTRLAQNKPNTRSWTLWERSIHQFTLPTKLTLKQFLGE